MKEKEMPMMQPDSPAEEAAESPAVEAMETGGGGPKAQGHAVPLTNTGGHHAQLAAKFHKEIGSPHPAPKGKGKY